MVQSDRLDVRVSLLRVGRAFALAAGLAFAFLFLASLLGVRSMGRVVVPAAMLAAAVVAWRWDGGGWSGPGPAEGRRGLQRLGAGFGWGMVVAGATLAGLLLTGVIDATADRHGFAGLRLIRAAAYYGLVAGGEEVLFRAYLLRTLARGFRSRTARLTIAAAMFAAVHAVNPDYGPLAFLFAAAMGLALGAAFERTGSLSLCIGFHWAFNLGQDAVWQVPPMGGEYVYLAAVALAAAPLAFGNARRRRHPRQRTPDAYQPPGARRPRIG